MSQLIEVKVPDIGDVSDVPVIEIFAQVGDTVNANDSLVMLESDKATLEVPAPSSGVLKTMKVKLGDKVSEGSVIAILECEGEAKNAIESAKPTQAPAPKTSPMPAMPSVAEKAEPITLAASSLALGSKAHATPSVRAYARELGVDLNAVTPTGEHGRILKEDVTSFVKSTLTAGVARQEDNTGQGLNLLPWPKVDFSKFGAIETKPLSRIQKISAQNLARNWAMIPAVTYHEDADVTELEAFRVQLNKENEKNPEAAKLTLLSFLIKAAVAALKQFPAFNSSIDGENLILKHYYHIGFAADTPTGLVVPVIKDVDQKNVYQIARETADLAKAARDGKLKPTDMQGASFTISSLGGIGSTYFAPIVNAPEVAILGASKSAMKPIWDGKQFVPRLILPLSLTADHRVIDGALATRFAVYLTKLLSDFRRVTL
ncbi:MAG: dihydrolipoyllysine-residue acetyltransferase [Burkholderiales bacterium]|jgi:pyruvate dehydrogenase E2 component (dihydrolipoamide acetyltransferase)|nr:dihydrolipoyllysine-residue acetyltransferase [Burkholderiales bacterium]